jgi:hypothetical protein
MGASGVVPRAADNPGRTAGGIPIAGNLRGD